MLDLVNKLPKEHYYTLKMLMVHLHRVFELSDSNLMNARNLGVVFGRTLLFDDLNGTNKTLHHSHPHEVFKSWR